jgi:type I protein arginine methyltransferase
VISPPGRRIPLQYHYQMLMDAARVEAFHAAIQLVVQPGARVADLGGGTGVLSFFAAQRGAQALCVEALPELASAARAFLEANGAEGVEVVEADARDFLPDEPVDVVICEMLHSALLREEQVAVLDSFRIRHHARFGSTPIFLPEATLLGVELVEQDYDFSGFQAPVPVFEDPGFPSERSRSLSSPAAYAIVDYRAPAPTRFEFMAYLAPTTSGRVNALRFITNNVLAIEAPTGRTINWMNQNLILPLAAPVSCADGDALRVSFAYQPGAEVDELAANISVQHGRT